MAGRDVYTMKEFLEVISLQEQTAFLDIKRQQRAAAAGDPASSVCSLEDMLDMMALQEKKAVFEKKRQEKLAQPNVRRTTVIELFGELHHSEGDAAPTSSPLVTFPVEESSGSRDGEERDSGEEARMANNHDGPRVGGGRNVGGGSNNRA